VLIEESATAVGVTVRWLTTGVELAEAAPAKAPVPPVIVYTSGIVPGPTGMQGPPGGG
jgi:hypothetical protein